MLAAMPASNPSSTGELRHVAHRHDAQRTSVMAAGQPSTELHRDGAVRASVWVREIAGPLGTVRVEGGLDQAVAALAAAQHGVVSRSQLEAVGLGRGAIARRVESGRLHRLHRGIYVVGHLALAPFARETAALLACGSTALLSHTSAAALWGLMPARSDIVEVTTPGGHCRRHRGVRSHRALELVAEDGRRRRRLPLTAPARTLLDIASVVDGHTLERALNEAFVQRLTRLTEIRALLQRLRHHSGSRALRDLVGRLEGPSMTRSEAEQRLLALLAAAGLPMPVTNVRVGRYEVDALWKHHRLVVEVDGYAFHSTRAAFERDRARDGELQARGLRVLRVTWRQLVDEPEATVGRIARLLGPGGD
jgi:very-short-patch-repair endonuclease